MKEDKDKWNDFRNNAENALSLIYRQNIDFLFFYGKKFTIEEDFILDMIHDLFCDLIKYRKTLSETDNIRLYLMKSLRRRLLRGMENKRKFSKLDNNRNLQPEMVFSIEEEMISDEEQSRRNMFIKKGLKELNAKQREVLYYKFTLGYDYNQISEIMSISYDSARQLVSRSINSLKHFMADKNVFYCAHL